MNPWLFPLPEKHIENEISVSWPNVTIVRGEVETYPETGFYNYNARLYDPEICRFISADSIVPNPYDTQSFNRYSYVRNNPMIYTDPTGHCSDDGTCHGECIRGATPSVNSGSGSSTYWSWMSSAYSGSAGDSSRDGSPYPDQNLPDGLRGMGTSENRGERFGDRTLEENQRDAYIAYAQDAKSRSDDIMRLNAENEIIKRDALKKYAGGSVSGAPGGSGGGVTEQGAYIAQKPLDFLGGLWIPGASHNPIDDFLNTELSHQQIFFTDEQGGNIGFFGTLRSDDSQNYRVTHSGYNNTLMRLAVNMTPAPSSYFLIGANCQNWVANVQANYQFLSNLIHITIRVK